MMIKVYLVFKDTALYGYTKDKNLWSIFKKQRKKSMFRYIKKEVTEDEYDRIESELYLSKLISLPLHDGKDIITVICPISEENNLDVVCNIIIGNLYCMDRNSSSLPLKNKWVDMIKYFLNISSIEYSQIDKLDQVRVYLKSFGDTYKE